MQIVLTSHAQRSTRRSARRRPPRNATLDGHAVVFVAISARTCRRLVSALWQVFLLKQLLVAQGKYKVLGLRMQDVIPHDLGRRAPFIGVVATGARLLTHAFSRLSHGQAFSTCFNQFLHSSPAGAFTDVILFAPVGSVLPAGTVSHRFWPQSVDSSVCFRRPLASTVLPVGGGCFMDICCGNSVIGGPATEGAGQPG